MDKTQAVDAFWKSFGLKAYDSFAVPTGKDAPDYPYITYTSATDSLDFPVSVTANLWYRSTSWEDAEKMTDDISRTIDSMIPIKIDTGFVWIKRGTPFAQRLGDDTDDMIKRMFLNIEIEYLTAH